MSATDQIDTYLAGLPEDQGAALASLRDTINGACREAVEVWAYGMPGFKYRGRPLAYFAAAKNHLGLYGPVAVDRVKELEGYDASKGTVRFTPKKPLPKTLVRKLIRLRMADIEAEESRRGGAKRKPSSTAGRSARKPAANRAASTR